MKRTGFWIIITVILLLSIVLSAVSCSSYSDFSHEYYGGDTINREMLSEILESLFEDTKEQETGISENGLITRETKGEAEITEENITEKISTESNSQTDNGYSESDLLYWTENGEVWHKSKDCRYLRNSKEIICGTYSDAIDAGKVRPCSACCKN